MARINFDLRNKTVYFDFTHKGMRLYRSTSISVDPQYWDSLKGRARVSVNYPSAKNINQSLGELESQVFSTFNRLKEQLGRTPTKNELADKLSGGKKKTQGFRVFVETYLIDNPDNLKPKTIAGYRTTLSKIEGFHSSLRIEDKGLDLIDYPYYAGFITHCRKTGDTEGNINSRRIKNFKTLLRKANMLGYTENLIYMDSRIRRRKIEPVNEVVRKEEIDELLSLENLTEKDALYRDFLVFGIFTGARISDLKRFTKRNLVIDRKVKDKYSLVYRSVKTGKEVSVPLSATAYELWEKHNFKIFPNVSEPTLNKRFKKICSLLPSMNVERMYVDSNGAEVVLPRFAKITTHSMRRSFCTRLAELGMPLNQIRVYSGHKTINALEVYIKGVVDLSDEHLREKYFF